MRRHVVGAFRIMGVIRAFGREPREDSFEIAQHGGIGVFLNEQRRGGVATERRRQPLRHARAARKVADGLGKFVKSAPGCVDPQDFGLVCRMERMCESAWESPVPQAF